MAVAETPIETEIETPLDRVETGILLVTRRASCLRSSMSTSNRRDSGRTFPG
jgi:hypothetical protein